MLSGGDGNHNLHARTSFNLSGHLTPNKSRRPLVIAERVAVAVERPSPRPPTTGNAVGPGQKLGCMAGLDERLHNAARQGDVSAVTAALAAGADPNLMFGGDQWTPLVCAAYTGHTACVEVLLAAGADPNKACMGLACYTSLQAAASALSAECTAALLAAGAQPLHKSAGYTPLHNAAHAIHDPYARRPLADPLPVLRLLVAAAPQAAGMEDFNGLTPLEYALDCGSCVRPKPNGRPHVPAAACLIDHGVLQPAWYVLKALQRAEAAALPLHPKLASRQALPSWLWDLMPSPCPGLGAALPAVLERSVEEAGLLVRKLPAADRDRLRMAALCLACGRRPSRLALLPTPIIWHLLAMAMAG
ncbi:hypothetical protein ABPG75_009398 [Micractinium tetrahymenae]